MPGATQSVAAKGTAPAIARGRAISWRARQQAPEAHCFGGGGGGGGLYRSGKLRPFGPFHLKLSEYFLGLALSSLFGLGWMISYFQPAVGRASAQGRVGGSLRVEPPPALDITQVHQHGPERAPLRSQKRAASSGVWNSSVMCVLESGSFVDVQPISGFDQRFV